MSSVVTEFPIQEYANHSIAQILEQAPLNNRVFINIAEQKFTVEINNQPSDASDQRLELVIFSTLTLTHLVNLVEQCHISLTEFTAKNHRASLTSYRFNVTSDNIEESINQLVDFTLAHEIEAALVQGAPTLEQPGLLVMDMDSTTIEIECIDEIAALAGVGEEVAAVTERAMQGELDFAQSLHQRVATLAGAPETILAEVAENIPLMPGLLSLIDVLKQHQWRVAIASGGFTYFADHLQQLLHLDAARANTLEIIDNKLTGKVLGDVIDAKAKAECLRDLQRDYNIADGQTVAMGDGANDLMMMKAAHLGVAYHAKPIVLKQADTSINNGGLDIMLHWLA